MSYTLEVRGDTGGHDWIPHTFLNITDSNGTSTNYGFAPKQQGQLAGTGNVEIQPIPNGKIGHEYDNTFSMPITDQQYDALMNYIHKTDANPDAYNLPAGEQCTVWAVRGLVTAGIIPPYFGPLPDNGDLTSTVLHLLFGFKQTELFNPYTQKILFEVNSLWHAFKNWTAPRREPLVLDLDGDGIETLGINATTHVVFDTDGDGLKTGTGWISADDGLLVFDRNANGTIDNGGELFGDQTLVNGVKASDGFSALAGEDTNADGKFDATDTNFTNVRVWQDANADGISQSSELHTLSELGITSINLTSTSTNITTNGNIQIAAGTYTKTDGTTGSAGNLNFSQNPFYSEFTNHLTLTDTALALPDMQGSGMVRVNNEKFENTRRVG